MNDTIVHESDSLPYEFLSMRKIMGQMQNSKQDQDILTIQKF